MTVKHTPGDYAAAIRSAPEVTAALSFVLVLFVWRTLHFVLRDWHSNPDFHRDYRAIWYFVDYREGFVRRGLFGQILDTFGVSAHSPAIFQIAVAMTAAACLLLVLLAVCAARLAASPVARLATFTIVITSPLYVFSSARELGRLDNVGIICGAICLAVLVPRRVSLVVGVPVAAILIGAATATEELAFAYLAPAVLAALWSRTDGRQTHRSRMGRALGLGALTLGPGLVIFVLSYLNPMPPRLAEYVLLLTGPPLYGGGFGSPAWSLTQSTEEGIRFVQSMGDHGTMTIVFAVAFAVTASCLYLLIRPPRTYWIAVAYLGAVSLALGVIAVDLMRWWSLSWVALVAVCVALRATAPRPSTQDLNASTQNQRPATSIGSRVLLGVTATICLLWALAAPIPGMAAGFTAWVDLLQRGFLG
jgi:hypothetical protein